MIQGDWTLSKIEQSVCEKILQRAKVGKEKYGTTMERDDLTFQEWITHLQEELMDAIVYIEKLKQDGKWCTIRKGYKKLSNFIKVSKPITNRYVFSYCIP